jgi:hypothetical protein
LTQPVSNFRKASRFATYIFLGDYTMVVVWTVIELAVAMICACFPAIRRLLARFYPSAFASTAQYSNENQLPSKSWYGPTSQQQGSVTNGEFVELRNTNTPENHAPPKVLPQASLSERRTGGRALQVRTTSTAWYDSDSR